MDEALWRSVVAELADRSEDEGQPDLYENMAGVAAGFLDYASYFDLTLVPPHMAEMPDDVQAAAVAHFQSVLSGDVTRTNPPGSPRITNFSDDFYKPAELAAMSRWWDVEPANRMSLTAASAEEFATVSTLCKEALRRLASSAPELHDETLVIVRDLVVAKPDGSSRIRYSGASSFALWGAITVNAEIQHNWMQMYRQIVHEAGHNLLFGLAREEPLVLNETTERAASPIRADPRPIDGVFHAAYVSAREAWALEALLVEHGKLGTLTATEAEVIDDLLRLSVLAFVDCVEALQSPEVRLTDLGKRVLGDCQRYVQDNFAVEPG